MQLLKRNNMLSSSPGFNIISSLFHYARQQKVFRLCISHRKKRVTIIYCLYNGFEKHRALGLSILGWKSPPIRESHYIPKKNLFFISYILFFLSNFLLISFLSNCTHSPIVCVLFVQVSLLFALGHDVFFFFLDEWRRFFLLILL